MVFQYITIALILEKIIGLYGTILLFKIFIIFILFISNPYKDLYLFTLA